MKEIDANSLLIQMRALAARSTAEPISPGQTINPSEGSSFGKLMSEAISEVNQQQKSASALSQAFEKGDPNVDIAEVMIQMQKANVSFEAITQVRNRLVSAYQDIMNMPI